MAETTVEELVDAAKKPGTFSIMNVLKERAYPREEVTVYLDEPSAYKASQINEKIEESSKKTSSVDSQNEIDKLIAEREALVAKLEENKYVFVITGISEGMREDLNEEAIKAFPVEYEESTSPLTGEITRKEIESKDRNRRFTNLIWHASIEKIIAPDGSEQDNVTFEDVLALREMLPLASIGVITQAVEKLRFATAVFMASVDEDFLAKS